MFTKFEPLPPLRSSFLARHDIGNGSLRLAQGKNILKKKLDLDVYLPTRGMNLQRPLCWTLEQKRSLIESVLIRRSIPPICAIQQVDDTYQIIDGKQRISTIIEYIKGEFSYRGYYCENLPREYMEQIDQHIFFAYVLYEHYDKTISDKDKIEWFKWINFAGTVQDIEHMKKLEGG